MVALRIDECEAKVIDIATAEANPPNVDGADLDPFSTSSTCRHHFQHRIHHLY